MQILLRQVEILLDFEFYGTLWINENNKNNNRLIIGP